MVNTNIRDPNIAAGFAALANAFIPNAGGLIEADMKRKQADGIVADTNRTNVDATRLAADRERLLSQKARTDGFINADANIAAILANPNPSDPAWRAALAAAAAAAENGLKDGPGGITGFSTYIDPQFAGNAENFSNILLGTGVVDSYASTPSGFNIGEAGEMARNTADNTRAVDVARLDDAGALARNAADNSRAMDVARLDDAGALARNTADNEQALAAARIQAQAAMERLQYSTTTPLAPGAAGSGRGGGGTPLSVPPATVETFTETITGKIEQLYPGAIVDPAMLNALTSEAIQIYQTGRNADAAIAQVLSGLTTQPPTTDNSNLPFYWGPDEVTRAGNPSAAPPVGGAPPAAAPAAAPAATPAAAPTPLPLTATDANGRKVMFDPNTNQWVPVGPVAQP